MANQAIALQARAPRIPTYNELVAGRDQARSRQNTMAMQEQGMQQAANAQAEAAQQKAAMRQALMMAGSGDIAGAEKQFGLGAGNLEVQTALSGVKKDQAEQVRAKLEAAGVAAFAALRIPDPEQRKALFRQASPMLQAAGWTPEQIAQFPVDDKSLDGAILNGLKPDEVAKMHAESQKGYTLAPGSKRFVGDKEIASVAPTEGITYVQTPEGLIPLPKTVSGGGGGTGLVGGPRGGADTVYGNGKFAQPPKPLTQSTIGEVQDFQRTSLIPATRGKVGAGPDKGTGAVGTYQITYGTLKDYAPKVLGDNWRNTPFTADVQERIAKAIYEDVKGGNLKDTWAGLPANKPGAYANVPWEQVRGKIAQVESGGGGGGVKMGQVIPGTAKPAPAAKGTAANAAPPASMTPEKKVARDTAVQDLLNAIEDAHEKGHLVAEDQSYIANMYQRVAEGRDYLPGGVAKKTSLDNISATAKQLLRLFIEKGTSGTLNTKAEQDAFLQSIGGSDSTYETRMRTLRNFAKQNGIPLPEPTAKSRRPAAAPASSGIPQGAIDRLKQNPSLRNAFDAKYGAGAAARVLGGR